MDRYPKYRAAAVQAAPIYLDLDATVEKSCQLIDQAASNGAKLVAFPEAFSSRLSLVCIYRTSRIYKGIL